MNYKFIILLLFITSVHLFIVDCIVWFKDLRKEHVALCDEVKSITAESFPGSEVLTALQSLGKVLDYDFSLIMVYLQFD